MAKHHTCRYGYRRGSVLCSADARQAAGTGHLEFEVRCRTRLLRQAPDLQQRRDGLLLGRVQHDGYAANDAQHAAQHAEHVQALVQQPVRQHRAARQGISSSRKYGTLFGAFLSTTIYCCSADNMTLLQGSPVLKGS